MDKKKMMMIMMPLAVLCLVSLGVSLWYYFTPSDEDNEDDNEESTEEENDSLLPDRPAFTLNVVNGDNETTETVTPTGDETVDVTVDGDTATTTGATTTTETTPAEQPAILTCEEGQTESNGECVPTITPPPAAATPPPAAATPPPAAATPPPAAATPLVCEDGFVNSNGVCTPVKPEYNYVTKHNTNLHGNVIKSMSNTTNTLDSVKSECNKMPACKYIVNNNSPYHKKYFLLSSKTNTINNANNVTVYEKSTNY